ncbi:MAG TPA: hypothetical protein VGL13_09990, partial [Polyangiaceae bacterium]
TLPGLLAQIAADPPRPILEVCSTLPDGLAAVVMRCLEKDVSRRFSNVGELALALAPYAAPPSRMSIERILAILGLSSVPMLAAPPLTATVTIPEGAARSALAPHTATSFGNTGPTAGQNRVVAGKTAGPVWIAVSALVALIGVVAWFGLRMLRAEDPALHATRAAASSVEKAEIEKADAAPRSPEGLAHEEPSAAPRGSIAAPEPSHAAPSETTAERLAPAPSATSVPVESRRAVAPVASAKPPVRRPSNTVRSAPLSNILDGRE